MQRVGIIQLSRFKSVGGFTVDEAAVAANAFLDESVDGVVARSGFELICIDGAQGTWLLRYEEARIVAQD